MKTDLEAYALFWQALPELESLPPEERSRLSQSLRHVRLEAGQSFLRAGEFSDRLAFIAEGLMRMYYLNAEGQEHTRAFCGEGVFTGAHTSLFFRRPSNFFIEAIQPADLVTLDPRQFMHLPKVVELLFWSLSDTFKIKEEREFSLLTLSAKERYLSFLGQWSKWSDRILDKHVASYLGITPVHLSRIKAELRQRPERF